MAKEKHNPITVGKRILQYSRPYRFFLWVALLLAVISSVASLSIPIQIGRGVDCMIGQGDVNKERLIPILIRLAVTALLYALSQWLMSLCTNRVAYGTVRDIRTTVFSHLENLPLRYLDAKRYGDTISRITTDIEVISDGLILGAAQLLTGIIMIVGTLFFMVSINLWIALIVVILTPLSLLVAGFIAKKTFAMSKQQAKVRGELTAYIEEMIGNQKLVQAFAHEEDAQKEFEEVNEQLRNSGLKATFFSSIVNPSTRFINGLIYAGVGIAGAFAVIKGVMSVGQLSSFLAYANQYTKPFNEISGVMAELQNAAACAQRVFELLDEPEESADGKRELTKASGRIELDQVSFSYAKEKPLIENLNLRVTPGQRIAIVGPTGCGKTTLINLLMRFYDTDRGEIRLDHIPLREMSRESLRSSFGMVLQDTWLKTGTIRENIAYGKPEATEDEIRAAAREAFLEHTILQLPQGYDTIVSDDKQNISQGQKQLLCIARIMLLLPPLLILDEATSSIDTLTEVRIQKAFTNLMKGRTSFVVAHRLTTIKEADTILVMKDGSIVEQGTHKELLDQNGFYASMYQNA